MSEKNWKLRSKDVRTGRLGERVFENELGFIAAVQDAWRSFAMDISATLPDGTVLDDAALKSRYVVG